MSAAFDFARFSLRCALSAVLALVIAEALHLDHAMWAVISALVVARDSSEETRQAVAGRVMGSILGAAVALAADEIGRRVNCPPDLQLGAAVAIAALAAKAHPLIRVCMWTCAVVLLTTQPGVAVPTTALIRLSEVVIGISVSVALEMIDNRGIAWLLRRTQRLPIS